MWYGDSLVVGELFHHGFPEMRASHPPLRAAFSSMPDILVRRLEHRLDIGKRNAARFQHHQQMIEQIGGFGGQPVAIGADRGERGFDRLFAELLGAVLDALVEQLARIGNVRARLGALVNPPLEIVEGEIWLMRVYIPPNRNGVIPNRMDAYQRPRE